MRNPQTQSITNLWPPLQLSSSLLSPVRAQTSSSMPNFHDRPTVSATLATLHCLEVCSRAWTLTHSLHVGGFREWFCWARHCEGRGWNGFLNLYSHKAEHGATPRLNVGGECSSTPDIGIFPNLLFSSPQLPACFPAILVVVCSSTIYITPPNMSFSFYMNASFHTTSQAPSLSRAPSLFIFLAPTARAASEYLNSHPKHPTWGSSIIHLFLPLFPAVALLAPLPPRHGYPSPSVSLGASLVLQPPLPGVCEQPTTNRNLVPCPGIH